MNTDCSIVTFEIGTRWFLLVFWCVRVLCFAVDGPCMLQWQYHKSKLAAPPPQKHKNQRILGYFGYKVQTEVKKHKAQPKVGS